MSDAPVWFGAASTFAAVTVALGQLGYESRRRRKQQECSQAELISVYLGVRDIDGTPRACLVLRNGSRAPIGDIHALILDRKQPNTGSLVVWGGTLEPTDGTERCIPVLDSQEHFVPDPEAPGRYGLEVVTFNDVTGRSWTYREGRGVALVTTKRRRLGH